ncbi:hypothetical protein [Enteractinococcus helveticum]|uniref:Lipoprotein n=1 Tax=Enteractinococcus helveticum TaxID=1837282 RepID=A0A1B7LVM2_9MICC|nr:hypothetical protein [Enteractinococcus helveticum]OAV53971.1 hypothetical protein A6F49_00490 [Enteractinococcus helveticum]
MVIAIARWNHLGRVPLLVGAGLAVSGLTACQAAPETTVVNEYGVFSHQPTEEDVPAVVLDDEALQGVDDHYFRYLGDRETIDFYMARTNPDETTQGLCFIAVHADRDKAMSNCVGPEDIDDMIVPLDATTMGAPGQAFLIPDNAHIDLPAGWTKIRPNIVMVTDPDTAVDQVEGQLPANMGQEDFTLHREANR